MRCKICDWAPDIPGSLLRGSIVDGDPFAAPQGVRGWDGETQTYRCTKCDPKPFVEPSESLTEEWPILDEGITVMDEDEAAEPILPASWC